MAICGSACSITVDGDSTFEGHRFVITCNAPEIDVRTFGSGSYGSWLSCVKDGTIDIDSYANIAGLEAGDTADLVANTGTVTLTATSAQCTNVTCSVDSKDVVQWTYSFKLTGDITGW